MHVCACTCFATQRRALGTPSLQAKVFELDYADGRPTGKVLKIAHTGEQA